MRGCSVGTKRSIHSKHIRHTVFGYLRCDQGCRSSWMRYPAGTRATPRRKMHLARDHCAVTKRHSPTKAELFPASIVTRHQLRSRQTRKGFRAVRPCAATFIASQQRAPFYKSFHLNPPRIRLEPGDCSEHRPQVEAAAKHPFNPCAVSQHFQIQSTDPKEHGAQWASKTF